MAAIKPPTPTPVTPRRDSIILLFCLLVVFVALFWKSFLPGQVLFNNDGPLGANVAAQTRLPEGFTGIWNDLNWLGLDGGSAPADVSMLAFWLGGPVGYAKFWVPLSLLILGLSAWAFWRALGFSAFACVLGGLAAALQSCSFSGACWGQMAGALALAAMFLALALLQNNAGIRGWLKVVLAGFAVGGGVMEGFDKAALLSLVVAAYVIFQAWVTGKGTTFRRLLRGGGRLAVVVIFAAFLAAQSLTSLIGTQVKGVAGMGQDAQTKREKWDWATQWSLPKVETLSFIVPGLFGYRMDTPEGGNYWGKEGRDPAWDRYYASGKEGQPPHGFLRFVGGGGYVGSLMAAVALWGLLQSFRKKTSPFTVAQKKFIWFWAGLGFIGLLLAYGRFAPFYQLFYALPYASTIRNPDKFGMYFEWSLLVIFVFGVQGLSQRMTGNAAGRGMAAQWRAWWTSASGFDRKWISGSLLAVGGALLGWMIYASEKVELRKYLEEVQFDPASAAVIAGFSIAQVGWFVLFLALALGAVALMLSGYFSGARAKTGMLLLGLVLVLDLGRANLPWIIHWDYQQKYAPNPVIERLRGNAHEQRVAILPEWIPDAFQISDQAKGMEQYLNQLYRIEWAQHHFLYYNIQSLDVIQMPRQPVDYVAYESALQVRSGDTLRRMARKWELTNTRYLLGLTGFVDLLNKQFDPGRERFRVATQFNIVPKPGIDRPNKLEELTAETATNGNYAIIEFTGALPRAKLYTDWQVSTNDDATLQTLVNPAFDPAQTVLVANPAIGASAATNQPPGTVEFESYAPKHIKLKTQNPAAAVLLLNDRFADGWQVLVDGRPDTLLRCNYLMRGVRLAPGAHTVEFVFEHPTRFLKISLAAIGLAFALAGGLVLMRPRNA